MLSNIKTVLGDVLILFKNFFHWNASKILIFLWGICLGGIVFIVLGAVFYLLGGSYSSFLDHLINGKIASSFVQNIFLILSFFLMAFAFFYSYLLLIKLSLGYIHGKRVGFLKNKYLNLKLFRRYSALVGIFCVLVMAFSLIYFLVLQGFILVAGGTQQALLMSQSSVYNPFSISFLVFSLIYVLSFFYCVYRLIFSFCMIVDKKHQDEGILKILRKSLKKTKGIKKLLQTLLIACLFFTLVLPLNMYRSSNQTEQKQTQDYLLLSYAKKSGKEIPDQYKSTYDYLSEIYKGKSDEELMNSYKNSKNLDLLLMLLNFFVFTGLFAFVLSSVYTHIIEKKK